MTLKCPAAAARAAPTKRDVVVGVDLGTSAVKVAVLAEDGAILRRQRAGYEAVRTPPDAASEMPTATWWAAVISAVRRVLSREERVVGVGLSGQMHGLVAVDALGAALRPAITWADLRSRTMMSRFDQLTSPYRRELANPTVPGMAALIAMWLQEKEPQNVANACALVQPKDWLGGAMTGEFPSERSDASGTLLWNFTTGAWHEAVLSALQIDRERLPIILQSSATRGQLRGGPAGELGLPPGVPVTVGLADTAAALLGTGSTGTGATQLTVGSGAQLCVVTDRPSPDPSRRTHLFCAALDEQWYAMGAIASAGLTLNWVRELFGLSWATFYAEALGNHRERRSLVFHPFLAGERTPHMDDQLRASWKNLDSSHSRADLLRAALEGTAFAIRDAWDAVRELPLVQESPVLVTGGGVSRDSRLAQLLANALGTPLLVGREPDPSARGAALLAAHNRGWFGPSESPNPGPPELIVEPDAEAEALEDQLATFRRNLSTTGGSDPLELPEGVA